MIRFEKVSIPESRVVCQKIGKNIYVYYTTKAFRNSNGKPTSKRTIIGKAIDDKRLEMYPNENYFNLFNIERPFNPSGSLRIGNYLLFDKILKDLSLDKIISEIFPDTYNEIFTIALYMFANNKAIMHIDDYQEENKSYSNIISTSRCSKIFGDIKIKDKLNFFNKWVEVIKNLTPEEIYFAYDVTSRSSYSVNNEYIEWGYNRDNEDLPQVNTGVIRAEKIGLPAFYVDYSGSINDKSFLQYTLNYLKDFKVNLSKFVLDTGFCTIENMKYMALESIEFIICMPSNNVSVKKYISENVISSSANYIGTDNIHGTCFKSNLTNNKEINTHVFFDNEKMAVQEQTLYKLIAKYEEELSKLKTLTPTNVKKYGKFYDIKIAKDGTFTYKKNHEKIDKERKYLGHFAITTNDLTLSSSQIIRIYRLKDIVEKYFSVLKNFFDGDRTRTHSAETFEGKQFIGFISLIVKCYFDYKTEEYRKINKINDPIDKLIYEISKIKTVEINNVKRLYQPLTKKQKDILKCFNISKEDVEKILIYL